MPRKKKRKNYQFGGLISSILGGLEGGQTSSLLSNLGNTLSGFSNEPALSNVFSQSNSLFSNFQNQFGNKDNMEQIQGYKPLFDMFSLFQNGLNNTNFQDGGEVDREQLNSDVKGLLDMFKRDILHQTEMEKMDIAKEKFNARYGNEQARPNQVIPGMQSGGPASRGMFSPQETETFVNDYITLTQYMNSPEYRRRLRGTLDDPSEVDIEIDRRRDLLDRTFVNSGIDPSFIGQDIEGAVTTSPGGTITNEIQSVVDRSMSPETFMDDIQNNRNNVELLGQFGKELLMRNQVDNLRLVPGFKRSSGIHELSHGATAGMSQLNDKEKQVINESLSDFEQFFENTGSSQAEGERERLQSVHQYLSRETEVQARLNSLRKLAVERGIHQNFGEDFTQNQINQIKSLIDSDNELYRQYPDVNDLFNITKNSRSLLKLANTIASDVDPTQAVGRAKKGGKMKYYQSGSVVPVSPRGQFDYPGQAVVVPTPNGRITMNGVGQPIMATDSTGRTAILPANSGEYQFAPGNVLEIPVKPLSVRRSLKGKGTGKERRGTKRDINIHQLNKKGDPLIKDEIQMNGLKRENLMIRRNEIENFYANRVLSASEKRDKANQLNRVNQQLKILSDKSKRLNEKLMRSNPNLGKGGRIRRRLATKSVQNFNKRNKRTISKNKMGNVGYPFGKKIGF